MTILVTGATGTVGSEVLKRLAGKGAEVRAMVREPAKAELPSGVSIVKGDFNDEASLRAAFSGVTTLFLLNAVARDELVQAMAALNIAQKEGVRHVVYWSVLHSDIYTNVPHLATKYAVERMIDEQNMSATILRPSTFMQNDGMFKDALVGPGIYPFTIGDVGVSMVDVGDMADIAANELLRRDASSQALPRDVINLVGPDNLTGTDIAAIWAELLDRPVRYGGNDTAGFERMMSTHVASWMAFDFSLMLKRFQQDGILANQADIDRMTALLGRPPRAYRDFATALSTQWKSA